ncbi:Cohesin subunit SA-2 [Geodia barretti]|nr:Cohesin subunit SA-2 [Geodia barretti]
MFVESRSVSHTAAEFATRYLFSDDFMTRARGAKVPKGHKKPVDAQIKLVELVRFFMEVNIHQHATYFVDSLWDNTDVLRDWEAMVGLLLDDKAGIVLTGAEEAALIEILVCAVRRAVGTGVPPARTKGKVVTNKERRAIVEERTQLSTALMVTLPDLISKFGSVPEQASNLAHIPQAFDLELYAEHRLQKHLEALLKHLHQLVTKHMDSSTLDETAQTFRCLCDPEFSLHSTAELAFNQLMDELIQTFKTHLEGCQDQPINEEDSEEAIGLAVSLERIAAFAKVRDLSQWSLPELLIGLVDMAADGHVPDRVMCSVVAVLRLDLQWSLATMDETSPSRDSLRDLQSRFTRTLRCCRDLLMRGARPVMREAYMTLCDILVVFGRQLRACGQLGALAYVPDSGLQQLLQDYVVVEVIEGGGEEEEEGSEPSTESEAVAIAERLNDRRVQLAGFLKLVLFGSVDMKVAAPVFAQYVKHYHHFGDLLKMALARCREAQPTQWYKTIALSLQQVFLRLVEEGGGTVDLTDPQWADLRDLARRYSLPFSFDQLKASTRQMLVGIHREGINFALTRPEDHTPGAPPPYIQFLSVLGEFSNRLLDVDRTGKKGVLVYLQERLGEGGWEVGRDGWTPLHLFRNMLAGGDGSVDGRAGRGRGKGKKRTQKGGGGGEGEEWMSSRPAKTQRTTSPHEH